MSGESERHWLILRRLGVVLAAFVLLSALILEASASAPLVIPPQIGAQSKASDGTETINCSDIDTLHLDKQMNLHASHVMVKCGRRPTPRVADW